MANIITTAAIDNTTYTLPEWVKKRNLCVAGDKQWRIQKTFKGSIECQNHDDFRESECFDVYVDHFEISNETLPNPITKDDIFNSVFAWVADEHNKERMMVLLVKQ